MDEQKRAESPAAEARPRPSQQRLSMHDGIGVWCDCCSCEAEPRWIEVGERLGVDMSDFEQQER